MAPITAFGLLAMASAALAVPHVGHNHQHLHNRAAAAAAESSTSSTSSDSLSHFTAPGCWSTCFAKYNPKADGTLCTSSVGSSMRSCIETSCKNTAGAVKRYDAYIDSYCSASSYGASGTGTGTGTAAPTATSGVITTTTVCTETDTYTYLTTTLYSTYVVTSTITIEESGTATGAATGTATASVSSGSAVSALSTATTESVCPVVTVTTKVYETVTVTAGSVSSSSSTSASEVSPVQVSAASTTSKAAATTSTAAAASSTSASSASSASSSSSSSASSSSATLAAYVASSASSASSASAASSSSSSVSSSAASSTATSTTSSAGFSKRGLAYNDAADCDAFYSSDIMGWAYNWGSLPQGLSTSEVVYIPMLWSSDETFTSYWTTNAEECISDYNATYFFSFNEPDMTSQADMSPSEAAAAWLTYMEPYAGQVKLVAPAVTNGVGTGLGLDWLTEFISECSTCTIDAVNQHWYDSTSNDVDLFKQQIQDTITTTGKPIFVTEFAGIGTSGELVSFMDEVMDWMDSNDDVLGYSYYMVGDGYLNDGTGLSAIGEAYCGDTTS